MGECGARANGWRGDHTTTRRFSGPEPPLAGPERGSRGARAGRPAVLVSDMRDQHRPKQDLINEVTGLRKQIADLREAMTARRRVEDALRQCEEQLRLLVDAAPVGPLPVPAQRHAGGRQPSLRPPAGLRLGRRAAPGGGFAGRVRQPRGAGTGAGARRARARAGGGRRLPPEGRDPAGVRGHRLGRDRFAGASCWWCSSGSRSPGARRRSRRSAPRGRRGRGRGRRRPSESPSAAKGA